MPDEGSVQQVSIAAALRPAETLSYQTMLTLLLLCTYFHPSWSCLLCLVVEPG
jgi:hypothetical protein